VNVERPGRADGRTGPALTAPLLVPANPLADRFHLDAHPLEILDAFVEIIRAAPQFHYQHTLLAGENLGLQDNESQAKVAHKIGYDGLIDDFLGKSQYKCS
jgi:hypothetical protein